MFFQTCCLEKNSWFFQTNCLILVWLFQTTLQQALLRLHSSYKQMKHVEVLFQQFCLFSFISNVFQTNGDLTFTCSLWSACVVKLGCYMLCSGAFPNPFFAGVFPNSWFWCHACLWCFSKHHTSPTMCFSKHLLQSFPRLTALDNGWRTCPQLQQKCQNCPQPESTCGAGSGFWWGTHPTPIACIPGKFFDCHQKLPWHPSHRQCGICPCAQLGPSRLLFQKAAHGRAPRCGCLPSPFLPLCQMPHSSRCTPCILRPEAPRHADPCLRWHHCSPGSDASPQWPVAFPSQAFPSQWWSWALPWSWAFPNFPNPWTFPNPSSCWAFPNPEACRRRTRLQSPFPKAQQGSRWPSWLCHLSPLLLQPPATEWLLFFLAASAAKMSFSCCLSRAFPSSACSLAWHFFWALSSCSRCLTHLGITWVFPSQAIPLQVFPVGFSGGTGGARAKGPPLLILGAIRGFHLWLFQIRDFLEALGFSKPKWLFQTQRAFPSNRLFQTCGSSKAFSKTTNSSATGGCVNCDLLLVEVFVVVLYQGKLCLSLCAFVSIKLWTCAHAHMYVCMCVWLCLWVC